MKLRSITLVWTAMSVLSGVALAEESDGLLKLVQSIPLAAVEGRMDHFAYDAKGERLFLAALGNNTLEVADLKRSAASGRVGGLHEPQGVAFLADGGRVVVANGDGGECDFIDAATLKTVLRVQLSGDADNVRYDESARRVYVGYGNGALAAIDPADGRILGEVKLAAHPESFQLEKKGPRIFVNVPGAGQIAVIDRSTMAVTAI